MQPWNRSCHAETESQPSPGQSLTTPVAWSLFPEALMVVISRTVISFCQQKNFRRKYTVLPE